VRGIQILIRRGWCDRTARGFAGATVPEKNQCTGLPRKKTSARVSPEKQYMGLKKHIM